MRGDCYKDHYHIVIPLSVVSGRPLPLFVIKTVIKMIMIIVIGLIYLF